MIGKPTFKKPEYPGPMKLVRLRRANRAPDKMREIVNELPFLAYHVETANDGRLICITKPGGKSPFGRMKINDFMVWIFETATQGRWRISHQEIKEDVELKLHHRPRLGRDFVRTMLEVCSGAEPDKMKLKILRYSRLPGLPADLILKVYKWIWIQEDCNYPNGEGRWMSMRPLLKLAKIKL